MPDAIFAPDPLQKHLHGRSVAEAAAEHVRIVLGATLAFTIVAMAEKGRIDVTPVVAAAWLALSLLAVHRVRGTRSFILWNIALLIADSALDVVVMGQHLPAGVVASGLIAPWPSGNGAEAAVIAYWVLLWGVSMPNRTLAMLIRMHPTGYRMRALLFIAVIGLHLTFVEDVVYFAILGYLPFVSAPPLDFRYLPHLGELVWTAPAVWGAAAVGAVFFVVVSAIAWRHDAGR